MNYKRFGFSVIAVALVAVLTSCAPAVVGSEPEASSSPQGGIAVEEKILDVEITLPASFFTDLTAEEIQSKAAEAGYTNAQIGAEGDVTYTIPRPLYQKLLADMASGIDDGIAETLATEASILDITHDAKFSAFTMTTNRAAFEASPSAGFVAFGLGMQAMIFQSFDGTAEQDRRVVVSYIDESNGEEFGSYTLPDALQE